MSRNINAPMLGDTLPDVVKQATSGVFRGVHQFYSSGEWEWFRPIRPGDRMVSFAGVESVLEKDSEFAGRSVLVTRREVRMTDLGEVVAIRRQLMVYADRSASKERAKNSETVLALYTPEELSKHDEIYARETRRGSVTRFIEETSIGTALGPMAKGPLTVTEIVALHAGGYGSYQYLQASRLAYQLRQRTPALFTLNERGVPEIVQRVHWDPEAARSVGNPTAYDYGMMREFWLHHLLTDWAGDDGIVVRQNTQTRRFNFIGDLHVVSGVVVAVRPLDRGGEVDVEIEGLNQRGERTIFGSATVRLPSGITGAAEYPNVECEIQTRADAMLARHRELVAEGIRR
jgi:hypothetical protein